MENRSVHGETLAELPASRALEHLDLINDASAPALREAFGTEELKSFTLETAFIRWPGGHHDPPPWSYSGHAVGFIPSGKPPTDDAAILPGEKVEAQADLERGRIDVRLARLGIRQYPGGDTRHSVLFTFEGQNQVPGQTENVAFNLSSDVNEGEDSGTLNWPIFIGLNVGTEGVGFKFSTVNVKNETDEDMLGIMKSEPFKAGLKLIETAQPAIAPLAGIALGLGEAFLKRNENVRVQNVSLGLDFGTDPMGFRLAEGDYIVAQVAPSAQFGWDHWVFRKGAIVSRLDPYESSFPYNYVAFSVTKYRGD